MNQTTPFIIRLLAVLASCLTLSACDSQDPRAPFDTYLTRLARPLEQERPAIVIPNSPRLPSRSELRSELPSTRLDTLDFLALSGCKVQITIGKRNSSLGRMASASQRLLLELEYLELAPECIEHMQGAGKTELAKILRDAYELKQSQLATRIFEATLVGPEFRQFWRKPAQLKDYPQQTSSQVISTLNAITLDVQRWLAGDYRADNQHFELQLSDINKGDGGSLLEALALQSGSLEAADRMLNTAIDNGPLCSNMLRPATADILPRVVQKHFVQGIQPWSAALEQRRFELFTALQQLEQALSAALPEVYQQWQRERMQLSAYWAAAPKRHVMALQRLLEPCGGIGQSAAN
ncbi:DUF3080 family protein [Parahaliea sp. F7430]|uniref:DUF3080 family protein n=1 Tax=Sediminihaliea albiluteola TaxID=2758564 RepID=A0A7W2YJ91_9GAMM|nr:DUF3080 family protein [Sediminihaliea albiluteola]MBA6413316.1 DUF3080 family protein [Sediminihaliea albiluteola]